MKKRNWKFLPYLLLLPFSFILLREACWELDHDREKAEVFESGKIGKMELTSRGFGENVGGLFSFSKNKEYFFDVENSQTKGTVDVSAKFYFEHEGDDSLQLKFLPGSSIVLQPDEKKGNLYLKGSLLLIFSILPFWIIREIQTRR